MNPLNSIRLSTTLHEAIYELIKLTHKVHDLSQQVLGKTAILRNNTLIQLFT
jgi:hypothetical protein